MNLRGFRLIRRWTQDDLSQAAGVDRARISRLERGYVRPSERERRDLARALDVPAEILFPEK